MNKRTTTRTRTQTRNQHSHRWRIDEPDGPVSMGLCRGCGATREFRNWLSEGDFITNEEHRINRAA